MKKNFKSVYSIALTVVLGVGLTLTSCKKAETGPAGAKGDTGATGATGATGTNGANGTTGANGTNGTNGVANISTINFTCSNLNWTEGQEVGGNWVWEYQRTSPEITNAIYSSGAVMVYMGSSTEGYIALPFSLLGVQTAFGIFQGATGNTNTLNIAIQRLDGAQFPNPGGMDFKAVIIPPAMIKPNVDITNYNEVKIAYQLAD